MRHIIVALIITGSTYIHGDNFLRDETTKKVLDSRTSLEWSDDSSLSGLNWKSALDYCEELELDGFGWRLPNIVELRSIVDYTATSPIYPIFENMTENYYWSSSTNGATPSQAWEVYFKTGVITSTNKGYLSHNTICVRNHK